MYCPLGFKKYISPGENTQNTKKSEGNKIKNFINDIIQSPYFTLSKGIPRFQNSDNWGKRRAKQNAIFWFQSDLQKRRHVYYEKRGQSTHALPPTLLRRPVCIRREKERYKYSGCGMSLLLRLNSLQ